MMSRRGFWVVAGVYAVVMVSGAVPIPLWSVWSEQLRFGSFAITVAFGMYAVGVVGALTVCGPVSDRVGRVPVLVVALIATGLSTALLAAPRGLLELLAARLLSGIGAGLTTTTASAALLELAGDKPHLVSRIATAANVGGLSSGIVLSATALDAWGSDRRTILGIYVVLAGLVMTGLLAMRVVPETAANHRRGRLVELRRPTLPIGSRGRRSFAVAAGSVFVAFAVAGLFSSLVPGFLRDELHVTSPLLDGSIVASFFASALLAQLVASPRVLDPVAPGVGALLVGTAMIVAALLTGSATPFAAGTLVAGLGFGLTFRRGLAVTHRFADADRRADQLATYFLCAYAGNVVPTLGLGALAQLLG